MISARVVADSLSPQGVRITTMELEYPRMVHAELMTHRVFSRNSASSRAIPVSKVIELIKADPARPVHWGKNQPGMQAAEELEGRNLIAVQQLWIDAANQAISIANLMNERGAHKQVVNRILEPFQHMKIVLTSTEWNNWKWLRKHPDADPTIHALAEKVDIAREGSTPIQLEAGMWHMPYVNFQILGGKQIFDLGVTEKEALKISSSCCAQVSYRKSDDSLEKAEMIYGKLVESEPCHASPTEHQAKAFDTSFYWPEGTTHRTKDGTYWSGNLRGFIQHRQLIPNNAKYG